MTAVNHFFFVVTLAVALIAGVVLDDEGPPLTKKALLRSLVKETKSGKTLTIAVGVNACVDLVARAVPVMTAVNGEDGAVSDDAVKSWTAIESAEALAGTFKHHLAEGSACERHVDDEALFNNLVAAAQSMDNQHQSVGGNAALMAQRFGELATEDGRVLLVGPVGPGSGRLLHKAVRIATTSDPEGDDAPTDEVHLILEYGSGESWQGATAPRANRFIVTRDLANSAMDGLTQLYKQVARRNSAKVDLVVLSGLHMLPPATALPTIQKVRKLIRSIHLHQSGTPVHVELASIADVSLMRNIVNEVFPSADSIGLNEQELAAFFDALGGAYDEETLGISGASREGVTGTADDVPSPRVVAAVLRYIMERFPNLSRVHFHALQFHIVTQRKGYSAWTSAVSSAAAGSHAATFRACDVAVEDELTLHGNDLDLKSPLKVDTTPPFANTDVDMSAEVTADSPVATWSWPVKVSGLDGRQPSEDDPALVDAPLVNSAGVAQTDGSVDMVVFAVAPVVICKSPSKTVGLGDAISASGLVGHLN